MKTKAIACVHLGATLFVLLSCSYLCLAQAMPAFYQAYSVAPSYDYELSGRKDRVAGYVVRVDSLETLPSPGLVILVSGIAPGEGYAMVNGHKYDLPGQMGQTTALARDTAKNQPGKEGWYSYSSGDDMGGKVVIPLDARFESVSQSVPTMIGQTYHLLGRGRSATIRDFDFVFKYKSEQKRLLEQIPAWARRGKENF